MNVRIIDSSNNQYIYGQVIMDADRRSQPIQDGVWAPPIIAVGYESSQAQLTFGAATFFSGQPVPGTLGALANAVSMAIHLVEAHCAGE